MALSLSNARLVAASVLENHCISFSLLSTRRRGFVTASPAEVVPATVNNGGSGSNKMVGKVEKPVGKEASSPWAPDPITGYYKPCDGAAEVDAAELREMMLNHEVKSSPIN